MAIKIYISIIVYFALIIPVTQDCQCQVIEEWRASYVGPGSGDFMTSMALDTFGNIYVTGSSRNTINSSDWATVKYTSTGTQQWVARYNGLPNRGATAFSVAADRFGNAYVTGLGPDGRTTTIKYNSSGVQNWVAKFYGPYPQAMDIGFPSLAVDNYANIYVAACADWGVPTTYDYTIIKYDSSGIQQWVRTYSGPGYGNRTIDQPRRIVLDNSGNIYVTGFSMGDTTNNDIATLKYNSSGVQQWVVRYNGPANLGDSANSLAVDSYGNVYITGASCGTGNTGYDYITIKYNSNGVQQWASRYNGAGNGEDVATSIGLDNSGNVYVTGHTDTRSPYYWDIATIKYSSSGIQQWVAIYNNGSQDFGYSLSIDNNGYIYVLGSTAPILRTHMAMIKYSSSGVHQWSYVTSINENGESPVAIAVDSSDNVYVAGGDGHYLTLKYSQIAGIIPVSNELPDVYRLYQNYPNPFNPKTKINYQLPISNYVKLVVYNVLGNEIATLVNEKQTAGTYEVEWDGSNFASGVYFYRLTTDNYTETKKMLMIK